MNNRVHEKHRKFIRSLTCARCGASNPQCAHISMREFEGACIPYEDQKFKGKNGKTHDRWSVPLCLHCHAVQHNTGETTFWTRAGINPINLAKSLWQNTGNESAARGILVRARMGSPL